jgi:hypothetical protein
LIVIKEEVLLDHPWTLHRRSFVVIKDYMRIADLYGGISGNFEKAHVMGQL